MPGVTDKALAACREALDRLCGENDGPVLAAVSGGPDSMALLHLLALARPMGLGAATVDHQLRPESADEARAVARFCAAHDIPHAILTPEQPITGNVQSSARAARYKLLHRHADLGGYRWIATAHHADDQLETMLMRLARGAGLDGMAGIRAINGRIIRPLLDLRKADLLAVCAEAGLPFASDPSNANSDFDRVKMRTALAGFDNVPPAMAARSALALGEAGEALNWIVTREAAGHIQQSGAALVLDVQDWPREILRRLVLHCLLQVDPGCTPRGESLDRALAALKNGEKAMLGDVLITPGARWTFAMAPPRRAG
ncbi:MAG: tRNA lysidine(34) synthetase TilS [Blastomonas sp.]